MNQDQFDTLVKNLEDYAQRNPAGYKIRVGLLAALGYAYIFLVLAALIAVLLLLIKASVANFLVFKFGWLVLVFVWIILRSLWVRLPAPEGLELRRNDASLLFEMVEETSTALQSPQPQHILLTDDFNAAVVQVPRFGLLGWQVNYLIVGLPLMQALSPEQFCAVIAHELGHLSGNHGHFFGWIYRVRLTWIQLLVRMQQENRRADVFEIFLKWYAPYFNAYSFVLARAQEYEADKSAARIAGTETAAQALITLEVKSKFLEQKFWTDILKGSESQDTPPETAFAQMSDGLRNEVAPDDARGWIAQALKVKTDNEDTHPALTDRLAALGYSLDSKADRLPPAFLLPGAQEINAAEHFLAGSTERFTAEIGRAWKEKALPLWRERHAYIQEAQKKLRRLKEKAQRQPLTSEETLDYSLLIAELKGSEVAIPLFQRILASQPDDAAANYVLGQMLLGEMDESGITYIEKAMEREPGSALSGYESIYWFLIRQGREEEADSYRERAERHLELLERARSERQSVSAADQFLPHELPPEDIGKLREQLFGFEQVEAAYLVRKAVKHLPERPFYVLGVERQGRWYEVASALKDSELVKRLVNAMEFPSETQVIVLNKNVGWLEVIFSNMAGSEIYRRSGEVNS